MNPKRVCGSYALKRIIVVRVQDPNFRVHFLAALRRVAIN